MKFFVCPVKVLVHFQQLQWLYLLEHDFARRFISATVLKCINEALFYFSQYAKINRKLKVGELFRIQSVHAIIHLVLLHFGEYKTLVIESAILKLLRQIFVEELKK